MEALFAGWEGKQLLLTANKASSEQQLPSTVRFAEPLHLGLDLHLGVHYTIHLVVVLK